MGWLYCTICRTPEMTRRHGHRVPPTPRRGRSLATGLGVTTEVVNLTTGTLTKTAAASVTLEPVSAANLNADVCAVGRLWREPKGRRKAQ